MTRSKFVLAALLAFVSASASAQPSRTLYSLVETAMTKGETDQIDQRTARSFKLQLGNPTKVLWYDQGAADEHEHIFEVVLKEGKPAAVRIMVSKMTEEEGKQRLVGKHFLITVDGKLKTAMEFSGVVGRLVEKTLPLSAAKKAFEAEKRFWLEDSANLDFSK